MLSYVCHSFHYIYAIHIFINTLCSCPMTPSHLVFSLFTIYHLFITSLCSLSHCCFPFLFSFSIFFLFTVINHHFHYELNITPFHENEELSHRYESCRQLYIPSPVATPPGIPFHATHKDIFHAERERPQYLLYT